MSLKIIEFFFYLSGGLYFGHWQWVRTRWRWDGRYPSKYKETYPSTWDHYHSTSRTWRMVLHVTKSHSLRSQQSQTRVKSDWTFWFSKSHFFSLTKIFLPQILKSISVPQVLSGIRWLQKKFLHHSLVCKVVDFSAHKVVIKNEKKLNVHYQSTQGFDL